jgi:hypothetical protein
MIISYVAGVCEVNNPLVKVIDPFAPKAVSFTVVIVTDNPTVCKPPVPSKLGPERDKEIAGVVPLVDEMGATPVTAVTVPVVGVPASHFPATVL